MKYNRLLLFAVALGLTFVSCQSPIFKRCQTYTRTQVDSMVSAEVRQQLESYVKADTVGLKKIDYLELEIDKTANEKIDRLQSEHDDLITQTLTLIGVLFTILAAIIGILIPLLLDRRKERRLKRLNGKADERLEKLENRIKEAEDSAQKAYFSEMVTHAFYEKDIDMQIEYAKKIIEEFGNDKQFGSKAYFVRGTIYGNNGNYTKAIDDLTEAIKRNNNDEDAYISRGNAYGNNEDYNQAIKDFTEAIKINPNKANAYIGRGVIYLRKNIYDKAIEDYSEAIRAFPEYSLAYSNRGLSHYHLEEYDKAIEDCNKAIQINPNCFDAYNIRGLSYDSKGEKGGKGECYNNAITDFSMAIMKAQKVSDFVLAYSNRGLSYHHSGEYEKAINDCTWAIQIDSNCVEAYNIRGLSYDKKNESDEAIKNFEEAINRKPDYDRAVLNRVYSYYNRKEYEKAREDCASVILRNPDSVVANNIMASIMLRLGLFNDALQYANKAVELKPNSCDVYSTRCEIYMKLKLWDKAMEDARMGLGIANKEKKEEFTQKINKIELDMKS